METSPADNISKDLRQFIVENFLFGRDSSFSNEDSFIEMGVLDSTGVLELIAFLQKRYGIKMEDVEIVPENLDSIHRISVFVTRKLQANG
jgi:acyl carrier protein